MKTRKRFISLLLILTGTLTPGIGQPTSPGYLITLEGDTVSGTIQAVNGIYGPGQIDYFMVDPGTSERSLPAKEIATYTLVGTESDRQVKKSYYAKKWPPHNIRVFLEPRQDGKAQLYLLPDLEVVREPKDLNTIIFDSESANAPKKSAYYFSSPKTEFLLRLDEENYEPALKQMLRDCPELTDQIGRKKFKFKNLENIITFYNKSCE